MSEDESGVIPLSDGQNVQMKSQRSPSVVTGDPRHSAPQASKSSPAQAHCPRPIGRNRRRASNRQRQTAGKLVTFMTGIRRLVNAKAVRWLKLFARLWEQTFDQGNQVTVSHIATQFNIRDRVSMQAGRLSRVPNHSMERGPSDLLQLPVRESVPTSLVTNSQPLSPPRQIKGGIQ